MASGRCLICIPGILLFDCTVALVLPGYASAMEEAPRKRRLVEGLRERREKHLERNRIVRVAVAIFGFLVVLAGLAMLVLPGPGLLVIAIGLGILALEFVWAERLLERTVDKMDEATDAVKRSSPLQRVLGVALLALATVGVVAAAILWDLPVLPV